MSIKEIKAYFVGRSCNKNTKLVPASVYYYNENELYYFLSGILNSNCIILNDKILYEADSFSYLFMLEKRFIEAGIKASVNYDLNFRCLMIDADDVKNKVYEKKLKLNKNYKKFK